MTPCGTIDADLVARLRELDRVGRLSLPPPAGGSTVARHMALYEFGRTDLPLARLVEAHTDALAIFVEAGQLAPVGKLYGVWASDGPKSRLSIERLSNGRIRLNGTKKYCTGARLLDAALVTAHEVVSGTDQVSLVDVPLGDAGITADASEWVTPAFSGTDTASVTFDNIELSDANILGPPDWYLTRPGFWHGALGPAACWAGGAAALVDTARAAKRSDPHSRAHVGALEATEWGLRALLTQAAREIDTAPNEVEEARRRALMARHLIERLCTEVLDRFGRATGPQLLAFDARIARLHAELSLYIRQCHAERDLAEIPS